MVGEKGEERMRILTRAEMEAVTPRVNPEDIEAENRRQYLYALSKEVNKLLPAGWKSNPDESNGPALLFLHEASLEVFRVLVPIARRKCHTASTHAVQILGVFINRLTEQFLEYERESDREE